MKKIKGVYERERGSGTWWIRWADSDGKERREKVGQKSKAITLYQQRKNEIRAGRKMPANMRFRGERLEDVIDRAIEWYNSHRKPRTATTAIAHLEAARKALGRKLVNDLTAHDIDSWLSAHPDWAPATRNRHKSSLSRALQLALVSGHVERNVARLVSTRKENNERVRWLTTEEEAKLRAVTNPELMDMVDFALHTGVRKGEQFKLTWSDIHFEVRLVHLRETKGGKDRRVPMSETCYKLLTRLYEKRPRTNSFVFQSTHFKGQRLQDPKKAFRYAVRKAGIVDFHWHDLRHSFCSRLVMKGVDLYTVSKLAGHASVVTTQRYSHLAPDYLAGAVKVLDV